MKTLIRVDRTQPATKQPTPLHNRWHPDIPAVAAVEPNTAFRVECLDWTGGQIKDNDSAEDIRTVDLTQVHYLSGPIAIKGAKPGDLLVVEILDVGCFADDAWGFTGIFARDNGGGFLTDHFPHAAKAIWNIEGVYASSRHIPGVRFVGIPHPGLIGTAPSHKLLEQWNKREQALVATHPQRVPPLAELPRAQGACTGISKETTKEHVAAHGARTIPPRENGGNCDIKNLTKGSKAYFPVFIEGAHLSLGDLHFSQGDGEIAFCGGIEMAGWIDLKVNLIPAGMGRYNITAPFFESSVLEPRYSRHMVFEGISVDNQGKQHYLDAHIAYRNAVLHAINYLTHQGFTAEQAYLLLSAAPVEGRISGIVDIPNACCTIAVPIDIFHRSILL